MNKNTEDKNLAFVTKFYRSRRLDCNEAMKRVMMNGERLTLSERDETKWRKNVKRSTLIRIAASILLLISIGTSIYLANKDDTVVISAADTARIVTMPDNSRIALRPHSELSYESSDPRTLRLKGDAYFEVARDEKHPFTVNNGVSTVRVLGTRFQITQNGRATTVYVSQGRVSFSANATRDSIILSRNQKAEIRTGNASPLLIPTGSPNQTAWATGTLVFKNAGIDEVVADLSLCFNKKFVAPKTSKRITAEFKTDNLQEILNIIKETIGAEIHCVEQ